MDHKTLNAANDLVYNIVQVENDLKQVPDSMDEGDFVSIKFIRDSPLPDTDVRIKDLKVISALLNIINTDLLKNKASLEQQLNDL